MISRIKRYGWRPDVADQRDYQYKATRTQIARLPREIDLRPFMSKTIKDQKSLGACTGFGTGLLHSYAAARQNVALNSSPLFIYYNARLLEGTVGFDAGAEIRNAIKGIALYGACDEVAWPYRISYFSRRPGTAAYSQGSKRQALVYQRIDNENLNLIKARLASGHPVVIGMGVYESFEYIGSDGLMPMPHRSEQLLGGHAVALVGYNDYKKRFIARNSWGKSWGHKGDFYIPYPFVGSTSYCDDCWTIELIE
jgi:C1A family cysteine protease